MPITPKFKITQNDENVVLRINIPHVRITNMEIVADGTEFSFYCKPYLLKLKLPHDVDGESELCKGVYDPDSEDGIVTVTLPKFTQGLHFPNLDMLTTLLYSEPRVSSIVSTQHNKSPLIEEISSFDVTDSTVDGEGGETSKNVSDVTTTDIEEEDSIHLSSRHAYGFLNRYHNIFSPLRELVSDILQVSDPDSTSPEERRRNRLEQEVTDFDPERFLGDYIGGEEDALFIEASQYSPFWSKLSNITSSTSTTATEATATATSANEEDNNNNNNKEESIEFTNEETDAMINRLRNRDYPGLTSGSSHESSLLLGLTDLLFAYCYEMRITAGDLSVESASNMTRLSGLLSWLDAYQAGTPLAAVIQGSLRRSFVYPYLRCWTYSRMILNDVQQLLTCGKRFVLKALLQMKLLLDRTQSFYLLSKIFLDDYCIWIQRVSDDRLSMFANTYRDQVLSIVNAAPRSLEGLGLNLGKLLRWADEQLQSDECPEVPAFLYPETDTAAIAILIASTNILPSVSPSSDSSIGSLSQEKEVSGVLGLSDLLCHIKLGK